MPPHGQIIVTCQQKFNHISLLALSVNIASCAYLQAQTQFHAISSIDFIQIMA
jgi:hypothetical protein